MPDKRCLNGNNELANKYMSCFCCFFNELRYFSTYCINYKKCYVLSASSVTIFKYSITVKSTDSYALIVKIKIGQV